jgi:hypothetical protein
MQSNPIGFAALEHVYTRHAPILEHYAAGRHHFEHYDERLPGTRRTDWKTVRPGMMTGSYQVVDEGGFLWFQNQTWDVSPASVGVLANIVAELESALRPEVERAYEQAENERHERGSVRPLDAEH